MNEFIDWDLLRDACVRADLDAINEFDDLLELCGDPDDPTANYEWERIKHTTRRIHGENERHRADGVPDGLPIISATRRSGWMDEEVQAAPEARGEASPDVTGSLYLDSPSELYRMWERRSRRGCDRGNCCVYSMRYRAICPHRNTACTHDCRATVGSFAGCGAPLFTDSIFSEFFTFYGGNDGARNLTGSSQPFASRYRWRRQQKERADRAEVDRLTDTVSQARS